MPRTKGSKNKNINTAKNKNIININVNSSKSRKGRGRPRKQSNDTTQNRQSGGMGGMAPPQVIISQPQPDNSNNSSNSLLSSFITSKLLNESMNLNRTNMTNIEQPTTREQPSYFNARESIIPRLPDTPLKQEVQPPTEKGPPKVTPKEMIDASEKLKAAAKTKLYSKEYNDYVKEKRAANKIESAMQSKQYSNELKQFQAVNKTLGPAIKQALTRNQYIKAKDKYFDKKQKNKLNTMEAQVDYI